MKNTLMKLVALCFIALMTCGNADAGWFGWGSGGSGGSSGSWGGGSAGSSWGSGGSGGSWGSGGSTGLVRTASWGSGGSSGSWGGGSAGASTGSGGSWGGHRPLRNLFARIRARHASHGSGGSGGSSRGTYGWGSGGSSGSWGSGGSTGAYLAAYTPVSVAAPVHFGSSASYTSEYVAPSVVPSSIVGAPFVEAPVENYAYESPVYESSPIAADCCGGEVIQGGVEYGNVIENGTVIDGGGSWGPAESGIIQESGVIDSYTPADGVQNEVKTSGMLAIAVPEDAVIFVNDYKTTSTGAERRLLSSGLKPGKSYTYEVRAEQDGQALTKFVTLQAGEQAKLAFDFPKAAREETVLTVYVPEDAKVNLAGSDTKLEGTRRVFATKRLAKGKTWQDYTVKVTVEQDGRMVTKERTLTVRSGETYEMRFDFKENLVAAR